MKKLFTFTMVLISLAAMAQTEDDMMKTQDFKRWAIDIGAGVHKPTRPIIAGFVNTPAIGQADLGVRYNFTRTFGIGLEVGYNRFESDDDSAFEFESDYLRASLEGIVNLKNLVGLDHEGHKFGILGHGGIGVGLLNGQEPIQTNETDFHLNFMAGITPQYRIAKNLAIFGDLTIIGTTRNDYGWDGQLLPFEARGFEGMLINASAGITFYFGNGDNHADWAIDPIDAKVNEMADTMKKMAAEYADDDKDGVPNYIDRDNSTESGVRVDNKGRALDANKNGIPDDMESALAAGYASKSDLDNATKSMSNTNTSTGAANQDLIKQLINEGYVNVYFRFNSTKPTTYSLEAINTIMTYMNNNPGVSATLTGYADEIGNEGYNKNLSERRAKMVNDVLIASGIAAGRLSHNGDGEDSSVDKNSSEARQLVRRVTFRVN